MLQYKLRTLLLAMLLVAVMVWILFVLPDPIGAYTLTALLLVIPTLITAGIVYFRGYRQAFCIGAAPVQVSLSMPFYSLAPSPLSALPWSQLSGTILSGTLSTGGSMSFEGEYVKFYFLGAIVLTLVCGGAGMLIRFLAQPKDKSEQRPAASSRP